LFCFCIFYKFIGVFQTTLGRLNKLPVMQSVSNSHTNENRTRNVRSLHHSDSESVAVVKFGRSNWWGQETGERFGSHLGFAM